MNPIVSPFVVSGMSQQYGRRQALTVSTGVAGTVALAACSGNGQSRSQSPSSQDPPPTDESLVTLADIPVGGATAVTLNDRELIVARPDETSAVAFSAACPHQGCTVAPAENELRCPCHGSRFETLTGSVTNGPADAPLREVPVRVRDGQVVTA